MSGGLPTWGTPQGRNTNIHPFVGSAKDEKKREAPHIKKDSSPLSVLMFFAEIFHLLRLRQLHSPFYDETMARDRFLHILRFLHFADNSQRPDEGEEYGNGN
jgi:hypothetical protein